MTIKMVDVSQKPEEYREAMASGYIRLKPETIKLIKGGMVEKGDPVQISTLAGIQSAKFTPLLMPLCHPIPIENTEVKMSVKDDGILVTARVVASGKTGVEMEALTATAVALLNLWDIVKKYEKDEGGQYPTTEISSIRVLKKVKHRVGQL